MADGNGSKPGDVDVSALLDAEKAIAPAKMNGKQSMTSVTEMLSMIFAGVFSKDNVQSAMKLAEACATGDLDAMK